MRADGPRAAHPGGAGGIERDGNVDILFLRAMAEGAVRLPVSGTHAEGCPDGQVTDQYASAIAARIIPNKTYKKS